MALYDRYKEHLQKIKAEERAKTIIKKDYFERLWKRVSETFAKVNVYTTTMTVESVKESAKYDVSII